MMKAYAAAAVAVLCVTGSAQAHAVLESKKAPAASTYKAVLRVGHGCEGSPTKSIRVQIPEGVIAVRPMPKPGWSAVTQCTLGNQSPQQQRTDHRTAPPEPPQHGLPPFDRGSTRREAVLSSPLR